MLTLYSTPILGKEAKEKQTDKPTLFLFCMSFLVTHLGMSKAPVFYAFPMRSASNEWGLILFIIT